MDRLANNLMGFVIVAAVISIVLTILTIMYRRDKSVYVKIETLKEKKEKTIETKQKDDWCIRIIDVIFSLGALITLFPIFFVTTIVIKILSGESVLEKTDIVGKHKKVFELYRFRTTFAKKDISLGEFLRTTAINQLPTLINVLKGDLTFVGLHRMDLSQLKIAKEEIGNFEDVYEYGRPGVVDLLAFQMKEFRFEEIDSETYMWAIYNSNIEYLKRKSLKLMFMGMLKCVELTLG